MNKDSVDGCDWRGEVRTDEASKQIQSLDLCF